MNSTAICIGLDGCKTGWLGVSRSARSQELEAHLFTQLYPDIISYDIIGIDIPIGLPCSGSRQCDIDARKKIQPRGSCVFPAPIRSLIGIQNYTDACQRIMQIDGKKISKQTFFIMPKIAEADRFLQASPEFRTRMYEVHPEVSFCCLNRDTPLKTRKKRSEGKSERTSLIDGVYGQGTCAQLKQSLASYDGWDVDDLLDACAAFWTAERIMDGISKSLPIGQDEIDSTGLSMRIIY